MPDDHPLAGLSIVVTRPQRQGEITAKALVAAGADAIELPVLSITPCAYAIDTSGLARAYAIIFVSANAVEHGLEALRKNGGLPRSAVIAAIGEATTRALMEAGVPAVVSPQQSIDSEGLLVMPQLQAAQLKGQHVVIVRGKSAGGGRRVLEATLAARGATVDALECYERQSLVPPAARVKSLVESLNANFAVMALSVETLESLLKIFAPHQDWLRSAWILVPNARVADAVRAHGFSRVTEVGVSAESLVRALVELKTRMYRPVVGLADR